MKTKIAEMNKQQKQFKVFFTKLYQFLYEFSNLLRMPKQKKTNDKKKVTSF